MATKESLELRGKIWHLYCNEPNQTVIANRLGVSHQLVSYHIGKLKGNIQYRLNKIAIEEFQETRLKVIDSIQADIAKLTEKMDRIEDDPEALGVWLALNRERHNRRIDLYKVMGDGEAVIALKRRFEKEQTE